MEKINYILLWLEIRCGEYEFDSKGVHAITGDVDEFVDNYTSTFYESEVDKDGKWYYFNGGEIAVRVKEVTQISNNTYLTLKDYL